MLSWVFIPNTMLVSYIIRIVLKLFYDWNFMTDYLLCNDTLGLYCHKVSYDKSLLKSPSVHTSVL